MEKSTNKFLKSFKYLRMIFMAVLIFTFTTVSFANDNEYRKEIVNLVNIEREKANLPPLKEDNRLNALAEKKAKIMAKENNLSHNAGGYKSFSDIVKEAGIQYWNVGENIARNWKPPEEVMNAWLSSKGHRDNILSEKFTLIGVGKAVNEKGDIYWTQIFIRERE